MNWLNQSPHLVESSCTDCYPGCPLCTLCECCCECYDCYEFQQYEHDATVAITTATPSPAYL